MTKDFQKSKTFWKSAEICVESFVKMEASEDSSTEMVSDMLQKLSIANEAERKELLSEARPYLLAPDAPVKFKRHLESYNFFQYHTSNW